METLGRAHRTPPSAGLVGGMGTSILNFGANKVPPFLQLQEGLKH